jgi:hypothetical protein
VAGAAVGSTYNEVLRFNNEIRGNECGIIIKWAAPATGAPGVMMNFKTKFENNWNHEMLDVGFGEVTPNYYVDKTRERVDGGKLELIQFWWDQVSIIKMLIVNFFLVCPIQLPLFALFVCM